jgi:putative endonuclease
MPSGGSVYMATYRSDIFRNKSLPLCMNTEKFFVYIIQSKKDFSFYVGQTNDLDARLSKHNDGFSKYSSSKTPWHLVYFEMLDTRMEAIKREREIKLKKSRKYIEVLISKRFQ